MEAQYNLKSPGIKRLMREAAELAEPTEDYSANPLEDNLFEWHFTVRGPPNTEFEGGIYHGRIILPTEYPMKPPDIILLTPNGRFETNKKICLSISGHHPETWQPSWSIRTALIALIAFMPTASIGAIGSINYSKEERQALAKRSKNWECDLCGKISDKLLNPSHERTITKTLTHLSDTPNLTRNLENNEITNNEVRDTEFRNNEINNIGNNSNTTELPPNQIRDGVVFIVSFILIASILLLFIRRLCGCTFI